MAGRRLRDFCGDDCVPYCSEPEEYCRCQTLKLKDETLVLVEEGGKVVVLEGGLDVAGRLLDGEATFAKGKAAENEVFWGGGGGGGLLLRSEVEGRLVDKSLAATLARKVDGSELLLRLSCC